MRTPLQVKYLAMVLIDHVDRVAVVYQWNFEVEGLAAILSHLVLLRIALIGIQVLVREFHILLGGELAQGVTYELVVVEVGV